MVVVMPMVQRTLGSLLVTRACRQANNNNSNNDNNSSNSNSSGGWMSPRALTQLLSLVLVLLLLSPPGASGFGVCRSSFRCLNGGVERYGQSIFSPCRCMCRHGYTGPRCQYREVTRKRSSSLNVLNDFLQARLRAQQQGEEAYAPYDYGYGEGQVRPMQRRRRSRRRLHPRFFFRR